MKSTNINAGETPWYSGIKNEPYNPALDPRAFRNFNADDYLTIATLAGLTFAFGILTGFPPVRKSVAGGAMLELVNGYCVACRQSHDRLMGMGGLPNDRDRDDVAKYKNKQGFKN